MRILFLLVLAVGLLAATNKPAADSERGVSYFAAGPAYSVRIMQNDELISSLEVPAGVHLAITGVPASRELDAPMSERVTFHGDVEVRTQLASPTDVGMLSKELMELAPVHLWLYGVKVVVESAVFAEEDDR